MGLTLHYEWKAKVDAAEARELIIKLHELALDLPFDSVSEIFERNPVDGESRFATYDGDFFDGSLYLSRNREDGEQELVCVPGLHRMFFCCRVEGAETAAIGLASHPPVVVHREDVIERDEDGSDVGRIIGQGAPIEFPTERRGYYSWQSFCKTQYAGNPKLGGAANFLRAHLSVVELCDKITDAGINVSIVDDSGYAEHRDIDRLLKTVGEWDAMIANFAGALGDALGNEPGRIVAPIKERPDFEHLEAKGIDVLKKLVARQRDRKRR